MITYGSPVSKLITSFFQAISTSYLISIFELQYMLVQHTGKYFVGQTSEEAYLQISINQ